jgi:serine/threonine-protein kinase
MSIARSLTIIIAGSAALIAASACRDTPSPSPVLRLSLEQPDELVLSGGSNYSFGLSLAPDGRRLVLRASREGVARLWLRDLRGVDWRALPGTEGGVLPFWSPAGDAIAFFAHGKLRVLDVASETVRNLADAAAPAGGTWHANGDIVFAPAANGGLFRRTPDGRLEPLTSLEGAESSHRLPQLVDDHHVIFFVRAQERARQGVWIARLDRPNERRRLVSTDAHALALGDAVAYSSGGALVVQPVEFETLSLAGTPVLAGSAVGHGAEHQLFATSGGGVLIYGLASSGLRELRWVDSGGNPAGMLGEPMDAWEVRVSPAGSRVAVTRVDPQLDTLDIWIYEGEKPVPRRLSPAIDVDGSPAWRRDGSRVAWVNGRRTVTIRDAAAATPELALRKFEHDVRVTDWSSDGQWLIVSAARPGAGSDLVLMRARENGEVRPYAQAAFNETFGSVSPDNRWLAYVSDESGAPEIYVDRFPTPGARARLTVGGGAEPRWSRDGRSVFFQRGSAIHVVEVQPAGASLEAVRTRRLFDAGAELRSFDVSPDGTRLLLNVPAPGSEARPLGVLVNVRSLLPSAP